MKPIKNVIDKIVKKRNLNNQDKIQAEVLSNDLIQKFLEKNHEKITSIMIKNSMSSLFEYYNQIKDPNKVMVGYKPKLFLNGKVIDVCYAPTKAKIMQDKKRATKENLKLIDLPDKLHQVRLSQVYIDAERSEVLALIQNFLAKYSKNIHQRGLYLSGDFGRGKTYILAGFANQVAAMGKQVVFLHVPSFIASLTSHFEDNSLQKEIRRVADSDVLILDDIGAESLSQWSRDDVLGVILQARMDNVLPTFFSSNLDFEKLEAHFAETKNTIDPVKAARLMQRVRFLAKEVIVSGKNLRKF